MNYRLTFLLDCFASCIQPQRHYLCSVSCSAPALSTSPNSSWVQSYRICTELVYVYQPFESNRLDERGIYIPNYTANCSTQPSLANWIRRGLSNTTSIQNALNSCDTSHNVVNIPAGTWLS